MSKKILIALLVVLLAGGGIAFAQYGPVNGLLGFNPPPEINSEDDGREFGEGVAESAREINIDEVLPEQIEGTENDENENNEDEKEKSAVAEAVLDTLGDGVCPTDDGQTFGENVSEKAREDGRTLGENVSDAARGANNSQGQGNSNQGQGRP